MAEGHIIAMGGCAVGEPESDPLVDFALGLARRQPPRVLWLGTAGNEDPWFTLNFYDAMAGRVVDVRRVELFPWPPDDLRERVLESDVIWVSGGNTANALALWRVHGVHELLREAWEAGAVLCGPSAGGICWFEASVTDSFGPQLEGMHDGLGFLAGSMCPHYDGEERRRPVYTELVRGGFPAGYAADDGVGLHFAGTELAEAVTCREGARAYRVELVDGEVVETPLDTRLLG
ncbi:MAG: dipeptidase [Gaiellaceae bacterium]|nr:dipeptidase [Gaiellaceae bacterium]